MMDVGEVMEMEQSLWWAGWRGDGPRPQTDDGMAGACTAEWHTGPLERPAAGKTDAGREEVAGTDIAVEGIAGTAAPGISEMPMAGTGLAEEDNHSQTALCVARERRLEVRWRRIGGEPSMPRPSRELLAGQGQEEVGWRMRHKAWAEVVVLCETEEVEISWSRCRFDEVWQRALALASAQLSQPEVGLATALSTT